MAESDKKLKRLLMKVKECQGMLNSRIPVCCCLSLLSPLFLINSCQEPEGWQATPRTEILETDACIGFPSLAFPFGERDYLPSSFDMDCLLAYGSIPW